MNDTDTAVEAPSVHAEPLSAEGQGIVPEEPQKGNKEARYRVERNAAREALAAAEARITAYQRAEVERLASAALSHPADLFSLSGNELADYLGDDGSVDADKVAADVSAILAERPGMKRLSLPVDPSQGHGSRPPKPEPTWGALLTT